MDLQPARPFCIHLGRLKLLFFPVSFSTHFDAGVFNFLLFAVHRLYTSLCWKSLVY